MGFDAHFALIHGYKIRLAGQNILDLSILEGDDYQLIHEPEYRDELIERYVLDVELKKFLGEHKNWNVYVLTSSQSYPDLENSYFYLYDYRQILFTGRIPDYTSGTTGRVWEPKNEIEGIPFKTFGLSYHPYQQHWIVEGSW